MKHTIINTIALFTICSLAVISCKKTPTVAAATCSALDTKWSTSVNAIVQTKCAKSGCHDGSAKGGNYLTHAGINSNSSDESNCNNGRDGGGGGGDGGGVAVVVVIVIVE